MPSTKHSWFRPGLRFCGSCCVSLLYWAVWLVLGSTLAVLLYILLARELPVPNFILRQVEARFAEANFAIQFGRARLDPTGQILLEEVQLRSKKFADPVLRSRVVYLKRSFWSILAGRPIPDEIKLDGASLQLPSLLSPSGTAEPLASNLTVVLRHDDAIWHLDQLTGYVGRLKITIQGDLSPPPHTTGTKPSNPEEIFSQFLQLGRRLILEINHLEAFDDPSLTVHLENQHGIGNTAACVFTASAARRPWGQPVTLGPLTIRTTLRLDGPGERTVRLYATTRSVSQPDLFSLEHVNAILSAQFVAAPFTLKPTEVLLTVGSVSADHEQALGPVLRADLRDWPTVKVSTALQIEGKVIQADVTTNLTQKSARIVAEGTGAPATINRVLAKHTPRAAPFFIFSDPVVVSAEAVFSPGWHFDQVTTRVAAGRINSRDVKITSARGRIDIVGMSFLAYDAQIEMGENVARGSYWMNFSTTDYRMLLKGQLRPPEISGWFTGNWWTDFWNAHFDFSAVLPEGDVDVQGRWRDVMRTEFFGRADATTAGVWGGKFDQVQASVFLRPAFTHVIEFKGIRAGGAQRLGGSLKRFGATGSREKDRLEFDLEGNVDPATYHGMLDGKADEVMTSLKFSAPPHVHAQGAIVGLGAAATANYTFSGHAEGGLHYYDFPVETVRVTGAVNGSEIHLEDIQFTAAGGTGSGKAAVSGPEGQRKLGFDLYLNGADLPRTILAVQEYQGKQSDQKSAYTPDRDFLKQVAGGRLDVALSAQGTPGNVPTFSGTGNAALTGANLGEIRLFGLLSQVLSGLALNFSSLKLDAAHTSFRLDNGRLHFPDLKITGSSAVIDARGDFVLATSALDFTAKFKPFEENKTLLTLAIGIVVNPITSILELKLNGPLNKPNWSFTFGTSSLSEPLSLPKNEVLLAVPLPEK